MSGAPRLPDAAAVAVELDKIESVISGAHRLLEDGRLIDLAALDRRTRQVCDAMTALPRPAVRELTPRLKSLVDRLDGLSAALESRFGDVPVMPNHGSAAAAYASLLKHFP